tara:strand:+ start:11292 stop:11474 length:183 start_codon:yes stop_codon:yes gene_type:complete
MSVLVIEMKKTEHNPSFLKQLEEVEDILYFPLNSDNNHTFNKWDELIDAIDNSTKVITLI